MRGVRENQWFLQHIRTQNSRADFDFLRLNGVPRLNR